MRAFPGAQGWAAFTPGGRGGAIVRVTTLAASGPGSLAEALAAPGPRTVVFEVGGVIDLQGMTLEVSFSHLTVAGQTAPSPGITLVRGGLLIRTHDVVIQHLRVRPGEAGHAKTSGWEIDGIATEGALAHDVIIDHCSISWSTDENLSASGGRFEGLTPEDWRRGTSHRITFSNSIVAEGLGHSTHSKGEHSMGTLVHDNVTDVALVGNLYASNNDRNPLFKGGARGLVANNYIHNPGKDGIKYNLWAQEWRGRVYQTGHMTIVGNVLQYGPSTENTALMRVDGQGACELFMADNIATDRGGASVSLLAGLPENIEMVSMPLLPEGFELLPAVELRSEVLRQAGARPWDRDPIDARIVEEVRSGGGNRVSSEQEVGGYPGPSETRAPFDPEAWDLSTMTRRSGEP